MIFKSGDASGDLNGFIDRGSALQGELRFEHDFRVEGKIQGTVISSGDLVVGEGGEVEGEISVGQIFISGTVRGKVTASKKVQIAPGGKVLAELNTPALIIEDGALFEGSCSMSRGKGAEDAGPKLLGPVKGAKPVS